MRDLRQRFLDLGYCFREEDYPEAWRSRELL